MAEPRKILINESSYQALKESFNFKSAGEFILKNKRQPVMVYEVRD